MNYGQIGLCHFCEHHGPNVMFQSRVIEDSNKSEGRISDGEINKTYKPWPCIACLPLDSGHPGFVSFTHGKRLAIVSSDKPESPLYKRLHQACFQSLSSEVSPVKDSFIFFTDPGNSVSVASFPFILKDSAARGFRRLYSIVYLNPSQPDLLKCFTQLEPQIMKLSSELQNMASKVYAKEELICSQKALRTAVQLSTLGTVRSLQDLTQNPDIFVYLHSKFCEMLETCRQSIIHVSGLSANKNLLPLDSVPLLRDLLSKLCRTTFRQITYHLLKGGGIQVQTDNLSQTERVFTALNLIVPTFDCINIRDTLILHLKSDSLSIHSETENSCHKGSRLVTRFENLVFMEDLPDRLLLQQLLSLHDDIRSAAEMYSKLKLSEPSKLLHFFQVLGYTTEDLVVFDCWSCKEI